MCNWIPGNVELPGILFKENISIVISGRFRLYIRPAGTLQNKIATQFSFDTLTHVAVLDSLRLTSCSLRTDAHQVPADTSIQSSAV